MGEETVKEEKIEVVTAVYKVNIHCQECAREIRKPLLKSQGIHSVDIDCEKCEVTVKGEIDVIKIHKTIEKFSKKKVELISPTIEELEKEEEERKKKDEEKKKEEVKEEIKIEETICITSVKVHLHCEQCEQDLRKKLIRHKAIYNVEIDSKEEILTVKGSIESEKLLSYLRKKVHKHAEIISSTKVIKEEKKKEEVVVEEKKEEIKVEEKKEEITIEEKKEEIKIEEKIEIVEFKEEVKVEVKNEEFPYFIHYVYAPQCFSDENPNACFIM